MRISLACPHRRVAVLAAALLATLLAPTARVLAAEHIVHLRTETAQERFRFEPSLLLIPAGDSVRFVPDSRMHEAKTVAGMLPDGARRWRGRMGEEMLVTFDRPGVYGIKCGAHYQVGMVALVIVGRDLPNWDSARSVRHPPMVTTEFTRLFAQAACALRRPDAMNCAPPPP